MGFLVISVFEYTRSSKFEVMYVIRIKGLNLYRLINDIHQDFLQVSYNKVFMPQFSLISSRDLSLLSPRPLHPLPLPSLQGP